MRTVVRLYAVLVTAAMGILGCGPRRGGPAGEIPVVSADLYYEYVPKGTDVDWESAIPVSHFWLDIPGDGFLFGAPSTAQVDRWKALCEAVNPVISATRREVQGDHMNMNQFMTVRDFIELWYREDSYVADDSLTLWRLEQYDAYNSRNSYSCDSEFDRFAQLKDIIQSLCLYEAGTQWELNFHSCLECDFQEFYDRLLIKEAVLHADAELGKALLDEDATWKEYHAALDSAFRIIDGDPHGMNGSAWTMAICGIARDDAEMRAVSLKDFVFALTDSLDYGPAGNHRRNRIGEYEIQRYGRFTEGMVVSEYRRFMDLFGDPKHFDPEYSYPVSVLRKSLEDEMVAWSGWMAARKRVSSLLTRLCRDVYDNATNNVRREKLIMLKNRYQGYGLASGDILECILPYGCADSDIAGFSFEKRWSAL